MKVIKKQTNSKMCLICGVNNDLGIKASFYEVEDNTVVCIFKYQEFHQSYPGRAHGGMISSMLDEIIGRSVWIIDPSIWGVTIELTVKFRKPVPLNEEVKAVGWITENKTRTFIGKGEIRSLTGEVLAEASATYYKMPIDKISGDGFTLDDVNFIVPDDVTELE